MTYFSQDEEEGEGEADVNVDGSPLEANVVQYAMASLARIASLYCMLLKAACVDR